MSMTRFTTFFALMIGGMAVIQPAAAGVLVGLTGRIDLRLVGADAFQRRQTTGSSIPNVPEQCESVCDSVNTILQSDNCPPSQCCLASFDTMYFNCFACVATAINLTDYTQPQSFIDALYDQCASLGYQLPVLTFPGQSPNRTLSSVALSSQSTFSTISSTPTSSIVHTIIGPSTSTIASSQITVITNAPTPTSSSTSSGLRTETSCLNLVASMIMLGTWFYFAVQ